MATGCVRRGLTVLLTTLFIVGTVATPSTASTVRARALTSPPRPAACPMFGPRAIDFSDLNNENQVYGAIETPNNGEVEPFYGSAGDIYLTSGPHEFLQMGWYVGESSQLPYTATPRVFVGEYDANVSALEYLRQVAGPLAPGRFHNYRIQWDAVPGQYQFYFDGTRVATTLISHAVGLNWEGAFNGETHVCGAPMDAIASSNGGPTLQTGVNTMGGPGTYRYFNDDYRVYGGGYAYTSDAINHVAHTDWAKGYRLM